jgi:Carboxypeptidase regulatory-like domain
MRKRSVLLLTPVLVAGVAIGTADTATASLPNANHVTVATGVTTPNIDAHLQNAAAIKGKVLDAATGKGLSFTGVAAYQNGRFVASGYSDSTGAYVVGGLLAGSYALCVNGLSAGFYGPSPTGYLGRCYGGLYFNGSTVPTGAAKVTVVNGQVQVNKNIALGRAAAIAGKVTNPSGIALRYVAVLLRNRSTGARFFQVTGSDGRYVAKGLTASAKGYSVCFSPASATPTGTTGYLSRCYRNIAWNPTVATSGSFPATATPVSVALGKTHVGINQVLPRAGAISGTITDAATGKPIAHVSVTVFNSAGRAIMFTSTNGKGQYVARNLYAASGDRVCASPTSVTTATLLVKYAGKCWKNVAWGGGTMPSAAGPVSVHLRAVHTGINLRPGRTVIRLASIAGTITEKAGGTRLNGADVFVYTSGGAPAGSTTTDATGHYIVRGLRASSTGYVVCAKATTSTVSGGTTPASSWAPRCSIDVGWSELTIPSTAKRWPLSAGQARIGVNIALRVGGAVAGTTFAGTGPSVASLVQVELFTAGGRKLRTTSSQFDGTYSFTGLNPAAGTAGYFVCFDGRQGFIFAQGYRPQCYLNVPWSGTA